jgi:hypothetical protein
VAELWFDPQTGQAGAPGSGWRVIRDGAEVTVHADSVSIGTARWKIGGGLRDRKALDPRITDSAWSKLERVIRELDRPAYEQQPLQPGSSGAWVILVCLLMLGGAIGALIAFTSHGGTPLLATAIGAGALAIVLGSYVVVGFGRSCPSCKAWSRRQVINVDSYGTTTEHALEWDFDGQADGTNLRSVEKAVSRFRHHYRCKACGHKWTGGVQSQSTRISESQ